jgi:hypothetical protein
LADDLPRSRSIQIDLHESIRPRLQSIASLARKSVTFGFPPPFGDTHVLIPPFRGVVRWPGFRGPPHCAENPMIKCLQLLTGPAVLPLCGFPSRNLTPLVSSFVTRARSTSWRYVHPGDEEKEDAVDNLF